MDYAAWGDVTPLLFRPIWLFEGVPVLSQAAIGWLSWIWSVSLAFCSIGLFTRWSMIVCWASSTYLFGLAESWGGLASGTACASLVMFVLMFSRAGDAFSVDGLLLRRGGGARRSASGEYRWPVRCVRLILVMVVAGAGVTKLRRSGLDWALSDALSIYLTSANYAPPDNYQMPITAWGVSIAQRPWLAKCVASLTLAIEVTYPLALVSEKSRKVIIPAALVMLGFFPLLVGPLFHFLIAAHAFWFRWDAVLARVSRWARRVYEVGAASDGHQAPRARDLDQDRP